MALVDPAKFREHQATALVDTALQRLIDAAEGAVVRRYGGLASVSERRRGGGLFLFLSRSAATITSVTERYGDPLGVSSVLLDATDYTLQADGATLRREYTGTHPADRWTDDTVVVFVPFDDAAERIRVEIALVKLDLTHNPGLTAERIGDWSEGYRTGDVSYSAEREDIIASLQAGLGFA